MPYPSFLQRAVCLLLAIQVTIVGAGFSVHEHLCLVKRTKTVSLFHNATCQTDTANAVCNNAHPDTCLKRSKCCLNKVSHYKLQTPSSNPGASLKVSSALGWILFFIPTYFPSSARTHKRGSSLLFSIQAKAPPLYGRSRLIFIQSFLI